MNSVFQQTKIRKLTGWNKKISLIVFWGDFKAIIVYKYGYAKQI